MSIVHCTDSRRNVTYVYESSNYWDKSAKKYKVRRKCIGKLDADGNIVPTRGRPGRPSKTVEDPAPEASFQGAQKAENDYQAIIKEQAQRISELEALLKRKESKLASLSKGLAALAKQIDGD